MRCRDRKKDIPPRNPQGSAGGETEGSEDVGIRWRSNGLFRLSRIRVPYRDVRHEESRVDERCSGCEWGEQHEPHAHSATPDGGAGRKLAVNSDNRATLLSSQSAVHAPPDKLQIW